MGLREVGLHVELRLDSRMVLPDEADDPTVWKVKQIEHVCTVTLWVDDSREAARTTDQDVLQETVDRESPTNPSHRALISEKDLLALAKQIKGELLALNEVSLVEIVESWIFRHLGNFAEYGGEKVTVTFQHDIRYKI